MKISKQIMMFIIGLHLINSSFTMEKISQKSSEEREERKEIKLLKKEEKTIGLSEPEKSKNASILLEIYNDSQQPYTLETNKKRIGTRINPENTRTPWAFIIPLYKITNNLSEFSAFLFDNEREANYLLSITLAKNPGIGKRLEAHLDNPVTEDYGEGVSEILEEVYSYKVKLLIPDINTPFDTKLITIEKSEKSPKGSLIERLSGSKIGSPRPSASPEKVEKMRK